MCGIAGMLSLNMEQIPHLRRALAVMNGLQRHRGPDGEGVWMHPAGHVGFAHRRISVIDLKTGQQPMRDRSGTWVTYNGEIYNYRFQNVYGPGETLGAGRWRGLLRPCGEM